MVVADLPDLRRPGLDPDQPPRPARGRRARAAVAARGRRGRRRRDAGAGADPVPPRPAGQPPQPAARRDQRFTIGDRRDAHRRVGSSTPGSGRTPGSAGSGRRAGTSTCGSICRACSPARPSPSSCRSRRSRWSGTASGGGRESPRDPAVRAGRPWLLSSARRAPRRPAARRAGDEPSRRPARPLRRRDRRRRPDWRWPFPRSAPGVGADRPAGIAFEVVVGRLTRAGLRRRAHPRPGSVPDAVPARTCGRARACIVGRDARRARRSGTAATAASGATTPRRPAARRRQPAVAASAATSTSASTPRGSSRSTPSCRWCRERWRPSSGTAERLVSGIGTRTDRRSCRRPRP